MSYRKFTAEFIFDGHQFLPENSILVTDDAGMIAGFEQESSGGEVEKLDGLLLPGFINAHCHLELSHMKGRIEPGSGLVPFLCRVIKERNFSPSVIADAMELASEEMHRVGIVAVGDICNTTDSLRVKNSSPLLWHNFIEVLGFTVEKANERFSYAEDLLRQFQQPILNSPGNVSLTPHAPYSVSQKLFSLINDAAGGQLISIHNQESPAENELYLERKGKMFQLFDALNIDSAFFHASGKSSLQTFLPWLNKADRILLVHNTYTSEEDMEFCNSFEQIFGSLFFCLCINANRYIEQVNPPIGLLRESGRKICLGTDSYASNWQLSILEEIKVIREQFPDIPLAEILQWSTLNGAEALGMEDSLGSFEAGKKPGLVIISHAEKGEIAKYSTASRIL